MSYVSKDGIGMGMPKTYGNGANAVQPIVDASVKHSGYVVVDDGTRGKNGVLYAIPAKGAAYRTIAGAAHAIGVSVRSLQRKLKNNGGTAKMGEYTVVRVGGGQ